ncbi:MAG TPA: TonB-dependent receptor plug domain-containing protein [Opitutaceae bacterium]
MTPSTPSLPRGVSKSAALTLLAALLALPAVAQQTAPAAAPAPTQTEAEREAARRQAELAANIITLSPFEVSADANNGYQATNTMSGTRLNSKLEDLASSITVVTKDQLMDTAAIDINDIFSTEGNTEGIYQYTDFTIDRGFTVDNVAQSPETANRVRGLGQANLASNNFARSKAIPVDTYNVDSVEISRGPNSNIFGLGEAAGTINLIRGNANLSRDTSQVSMRVDDRGSYRGTFDFNRVLIENTLAFRLAGVHDNVEYVRKPSRDRTNRLTASLSYRPFANTTIRGSYEAYSNYASRANSTTPRDTISEWRAAGSPVWDPTFNNNTGGWRLLNGTTYTSVTAAQEATLLPRGINPNFTNFWNRPSLYLNPDGSIGLYEVNRTSTTASPGGANTNLRYQQIGTVIQRGGGVFGTPLLPLYQQPGVTDQSIYDWEEINFAAANYSKKKADVYQVELEQWLIKGQTHQLAFQGGYLREEIDSLSRSFIGASDGAPPVIQVDINEKLLDGTPNPYFLQPYFGGSEMQTFRRPEENDNARATLAYQLDLTHEQGLLKWAGRHNFAVYGEYRQNIYAQNANGLRYRDQIVAPESWWTPANIANIPGSGAENRFYSRYYVGNAVNQAGSVIDSATASPNALYGTQTLRYFNGVTGQWVNEQVEVDEAYFALGMQKNQIRTRGLVWQGFLADGRIVPTLGWRRDKSRSVNNVTVPLMANGFLDESYLQRFPDTWVETSGPTTTKGVVVRPFAGWAGIERRASEGNVFADIARNLRFHYNESDSFQPAPAAYNLFGELLPDPTGTGEDYGFSFSTLDDKFYVRVNFYDTRQNAARNGATATIGTRPIRLDFDASGDSSVFNPLGGNNGGDNFDLEDTVSGWLIALNPTLSLAQLQAETYKIMGVTQEYVDSLKNKTLSDINNVESKGTEIEMYYNPSRFWTIKATITQQEAVDSSISPNIQRYINERMPYWTTIRVPTGISPLTGTQLPNAGRLWWEVGGVLNATGTNIPQNFYTVNVDAPYKLAVTNAGKPRPQTREWRANLTTNYKLAGMFGDHKWLKNVSVGGTARWEDEAIVGFLAGPADADGAVRQLDGNKPIYDKARAYADFMVNYNLKLFNNRVNARLQLNVRNVFESGRLQAVSYNPDGTAWNYRIIDPRQFILTATFDL